MSSHKISYLKIIKRKPFFHENWLVNVLECASVAKHFFQLSLIINMSPRRWLHIFPHTHTAKFEITNFDIQLIREVYLSGKQIRVRIIFFLQIEKKVYTPVHVDEK